MQRLVISLGLLIAGCPPATSTTEPTRTSPGDAHSHVVVDLPDPTPAPVDHHPAAVNISGEAIDRTAVGAPGPANDEHHPEEASEEAGEPEIARALPSVDSPDPPPPATDSGALRNEGGDGPSSDSRGRPGGDDTAAPPEAIIDRKRGRWRTIEAPKASWTNHPPSLGITVGRTLLVVGNGRRSVASFDPCRKRWTVHEIPKHLTLQHPHPTAIDSTHATLWGPDDQTGVIIDITTAAPTIIEPRSRPRVTRHVHQALPAGLLLGPDARLNVPQGDWTYLEYSEDIERALRFEPKSAGEGGGHVLYWNHGLTEDGRTSAGFSFDSRLNRWSHIAGAEAPSPRNQPLMVWTGREFFVYGGSVRRGGKARWLDDGGRWSPTEDRWHPVSRGPQLVGRPPVIKGDRRRGTVGGLSHGHQVIVWDAERIAAYDLRTDRWHTFGRPSETHRILSGGGQLVALGDEHVFVLDPRRRRWARFSLPASVSERQGMIAVLSSTHLMMWGGSTFPGAKGIRCPAGVICDPTQSLRQNHLDGAALRLGKCQ